MAPHHEILVFERLDQRVDRRLSDTDQRRPGGFTHNLGRIPKQLDQGRDSLRVANLPQGFGRSAFHRAITITTDRDERIDRRLISNLSAGLCRMLPNPPPFIFQRRDHTLKNRRAHLGRRVDGLIAHFHDGIVEQPDQRFQRLRPADLRHGATGIGPHGPEIVTAGTHQGVDGFGIAEFGQGLRRLLTRRIIDILERFQQIF